MKKTITILLLIFFNFSLAAQNITTLVVSGQGNTQLVAQHNALRNAIEQASGAFISSNTEIINNEIIKDEIISITNGNIQEFNVISEIKIPNGEYAVTLKATVSLQKLISFINNNGGQAELNGGLFAANVKQQILNEENEVKTIQNMCSVLDEIAKGMFEYDLTVNEPTSIPRDDNKWQVKLEVNVGLNENSSSYADYMYQTLTGLRLSSEEISNYLKLNKEVFPVSISPPESRGFQYINLRSNTSINLIIKQLLKIKISLLDFNIDNNINPINGSAYTSVIDYQHYNILLFKKILINGELGRNLKGTFFDGKGIYGILPYYTNSFFNTNNQYYITHDELSVDSKTGNMAEEQLDAHLKPYSLDNPHLAGTYSKYKRDRSEIFTNQYKDLKTDYFLRKCPFSSKEHKLYKRYSREHEALKVKINKHHLGLVISFNSFSKLYYDMIESEYNKEGKQISLPVITEFKYLATLTFKHNLTIDQIEQIDKYEINK